MNFKENRGSAMGMFNFIRYTGMACGPVISGMLLGMSSSVWFLAVSVSFMPQPPFDDRGHAESRRTKTLQEPNKKAARS